ncbi:MAG TPA: heme peroxidase family protein [Solirubrobacterales bacterium]|nr:heme peroxidase family protein [Solirubrobacterales bacterium]
MFPKDHGHRGIRGLKRIPRSKSYEGRFGRMFRRLPPAPSLGDGALRELAEQMRAPVPSKGLARGWGSPGAPPNKSDNSTIPAGFTYFGQFVDHDITFDPVSSMQRQNDPDALTDFRSPRFDLDSVYGSGPADEPFQYDKDSGGLKFLIETNVNGEQDLPRNSQGTALIGDPRNDENTIVSQLHLVFLRFHNKIADEVANDGSISGERRFEEIQRRVRWHYQWVILRDFLPRIVGPELLTELLTITDQAVQINLGWYKPKQSPYMPVEFSVAAFRYGHSQIRPAYHLNRKVRDRPMFTPGEPGPVADLRGFRPIPGGSTIDDWAFFLETGGGALKLQPSLKIDSQLSAGLFDLPGFDDAESSLAYRNLKRGEALGLPSGQDVARRLGVEPVLDGASLAAPAATPLWLYILKEAELSGGHCLGPVGARIVSEVLLGLLKGDSSSFVNAEPSWRPFLGPNPGNFTLGDLVVFATA